VCVGEANLWISDKHPIYFSAGETTGRGPDSNDDDHDNDGKGQGRAGQEGAAREEEEEKGPERTPEVGLACVWCFNLEYD